jgi:hypothetical protein
MLGRRMNVLTGHLLAGGTKPSTPEGVSVPFVLSCLFLGFESMSLLDDLEVKQCGNEMMKNDSHFQSAKFPSLAFAVFALVDR